MEELTNREGIRVVQRDDGGINLELKIGRRVLSIATCIQHDGWIGTSVGLMEEDISLGQCMELGIGTDHLDCKKLCGTRRTLEESEEPTALTIAAMCREMLEAAGHGRWTPKEDR